MTDTATIEQRADEILAERQAKYDAELREQVIADLKAEEDRKAEAQRLAEVAERHEKAIAASRKRVQRQAAIIENALTILGSAVSDLLALPHLTGAAPQAREVITWRVQTVLGQLPDLRVHPGLRQDRPLTEIF